MPCRLIAQALTESWRFCAFKQAGCWTVIMPPLEETKPEIMVIGPESGQSGTESVPGQLVVNRAIISAE